MGAWVPLGMQGSGVGAGVAAGDGAATEATADGATLDDAVKSLAKATREAAKPKPKVSP